MKMTAPTVTFYINSGTDGAPSWTQVTSSMAFYFGGPNTTASSLDAVTAPASGTKVADTLWGANYPTYGSGTQCSTYTGAVNTNRNVVGILFATNPTSTAPILQSWDTTSHSTTAYEMLAGTAGTSNTSWLKAYETTTGAPGSNWCTATTATAGANNPNALCGNTNYVQCATAATANETKTFNLVCWVPSDASAGTTGHTPQLTCKYTYT
jgi:hypothetical protein